MGKQRKQRQQPSKKKVQVMQKITKQDSSSPAPAKKTANARLPDVAETTCVFGLSNLGNTCFYNSALQALVSVPMLRDFCLEPAGPHHLKRGPIGSALQELVQTVYGRKEMSEVQSTKVSKVSERAGNPVFSPSRLLAAICKVAPQFKGGQQQDSHELLVKLIEGMLAEELRAVKALQEQEGEGDHSAASMTKALFGGVLSSQVACDDCGHKAVTLEPFYNLSLPIPSKLRADASAQAATKRTLKRITKKEKGNGKASVELPNSSPSAQEQAKHTSKQDRKKEKEEMSSRLSKRKQQKQAAGHSAGTKGDAAAERYREPPPALSESSAPMSGSPGKAAGAVSRESVPADSAGPGSGQPSEQLLGGFKDSDSGASSVTSLAVGPLCDGAPLAANLRVDRETLAANLDGAQETPADTACTRVDAPIAPPAELALPSNRHNQGIIPAAEHHPTITLPGMGPTREISPVEGITSASMLGQNLQSDTCISRDADTLTINAGENTEFPDGQTAATAAIYTRHILLASGQPSPHARRVRRSRQRSRSQAMDPRSAGPAPDAKSTAAPLGAAHSFPSLEDEEETSKLASQTSADRRLSEDSEDFMVDRRMVCQDSIGIPSSEGSGETAPVFGRQGQGEPSMRLTGGSGGAWQGGSSHMDGSHDSSDVHDDGQHCSSSSRDCAPDPIKGSSATSTSSKDATGLPPGDAQRRSLSTAGDDEHDGDVSGQDAGRPGQDLGSGQVGLVPELQREVSLGSISATSSVTNTDAALYEGLDSLRGEPAALNDLSSESEEEAAVAAERLKLGHFPVEEPSASNATEESAQTLEDGTEEEGQEDHSASPAEGGEPEADKSHKEVILEGCLAAFFAKEQVTWACPAEGRAESSAKSGGSQAQELSSCSPSMDTSTPEARQKFQRRSVSFSEEAPGVKFIPGSAEQRGTNFVLALSGERPFCRPLKHEGGYFLLTAEVDGETRESIFLGLQGQDESDETRDALESCNAIGGAIEFTSVKIDPIKDPANEDEQAQVMSQAQALLDCAADLVVHCGVLAAADLLQEGLQLQRSASWKPGHSSAEGWCITGKAPSKDGPATWEYPPATSEPGLTSRPKTDEVYVPREPLGKHQSSGSHTESPIANFKSRLGAIQQPIPELREGSENLASLGSSLGETGTQIRGALPNGVLSHSEQQGSSDDETSIPKKTISKGVSKPSSALSAALSEGSDASGSQQSQCKPASHALKERSSAAAGKTPPAGLEDVARVEHEEHGHSAPRSIPGSGRQVGRTRQLRTKPSVGLSASPSGVNSSTGTALFWTGSQALGIAFADSSESQCDESPADEPEAAEEVADGASNLAHSPLDTKARAHGLSFEASADHGEPNSSQHDKHSSDAISGNILEEVRKASSSADSASAKEVLAERADEDDRQRGISKVAAAAVAEVDAEKAQREGEAQQRSQTAGALSGELPPGEQLSERGSMDEEREALSVSPDLKHLKSVPELAKASPEAARPNAPLSVSPITLSPIPGPRSQSLPERSPAADVTPLPSRQASGRSNSVERLTRSILRNKIAGPIKRKAVKGYLVHRAPEVLTLHLKRFQQDLSGRLRKINGPVPFPQELDLSPFCDAEGKDAAGAQYTLVGVVEHQGSMAGGHYISYSARLSDGQPAPPGPTAQGTEPLRHVSSSAAASASSKTVARGKSAQNGPLMNGDANGKPAGSDDRRESEAGDRARGGAQQLRKSLAAGKEKLDAKNLLWFKASDAHVKAVSWEQVAACEPYLLMYVRT